MAFDVTPPEIVGFSRDRIVWKFQSDQAGVVSGSLAQNVLVLNGPIEASTRVPFRWGDTVLSLMAATTPDETGAQFPAGDGSPTYATTLATWLNKNYFLNENFTIEAATHEGQPALFFYARENGLGYDFNTANFPGGRVYNLVPGGASNVPLNPSVYVEVWLGNETGMQFKRIYQAPQSLDAESIAQFDVAPILHPHLRAELADYALPEAERCIYSTRRYYLKYAYAGGENFSVGQLETTDTHVVTMGGFSELGGGPVSVEGTFKGTTAADDRLLMVQDRTRWVRVDEPLYVSWINWRASGKNIHARATITYTDETTVTTNTATLANVAQYDRLRFGVGFGQLNLAALPKQVKEYTVQLRDDEGPVSEELRCLVDVSFRQYVRYFAHLNSYGGLEIVKTYGKGSGEWKLFRETAEQVLPYDLKSADGQFLDWNLSYQETFEVATGFLPRRHQRYFLDFFLSPLKHRIFNGMGHAINVVSESIQHGTDGQNLFGFTFKFHYSRQLDAVSEQELDALYNPTEQVPPGVLPGGTIVIPAPGSNWEGTIDPYPIQGSANPTASGGVWSRLAQKQDIIALGNTLHYLRGDGTLGNLENAIKAHQEHRPASEATSGEVQLATSAEVAAGTNATKAITPAQLKAALTVQFTRSFPAAEPIQQGQLVTVSNNTARLGLADEATGLAVGVAGASVSTGSSLRIQTQGSFMPGLNLVIHDYMDPENPALGVANYYDELVPGYVYYLSALVPGAITPTPPAVGIVLPVGYALSESEFCFSRGQPYRAGGGLVVDSENILMMDLTPVQRPVFDFPPIAESTPFSVTYALETYKTSYHLTENIMIKAIIELPAWLTASYDNTAKTLTLSGTPPEGATARVLVITEDHHANNGIDAIDIHYEEPLPPPIITAELWDFSVTPHVKLGDITDGALLPWSSQFNIRFTILNHTHNQVKQILLGPAVEFEWGPEDVDDGDPVSTSSHWIFGPEGDSDGRPAGQYVFFPQAWLDEQTSLPGHFGFTLTQEAAQPVVITAELWDFAVTPNRKIGNIVSGTTLAWSPRFNIKLTVSGPHTQVAQTLLGPGGSTDGWGPENSAGGALTTLQSHWVFGPTQDSNGRLPGAYTFSPKAYLNGVLKASPTFTFTIQQATQASLVGELWNEATQTRVAILAEYNGSFPLPPAWGIRLRSVGYAFNAVGISLSKAGVLVYNRTHTLTATTAETVVPLFPTGEDSTDQAGLDAGDYVAIFSLYINGSLVTTRNFNLSLGADPAASGMFTIQQAGKTFTFTDTPDVQLAVTAEGKVRLLLGTATKSSGNGQKTCHPYVLINERVPREAFRNDLLGATGRHFPAGKTYALMIAWLPDDVITGYADLADEGKLYAVSHVDNNSYLNSAGADYVNFTIHEDIS